jgi:hypothetical protein
MVNPESKTSHLPFPLMKNELSTNPAAALHVSRFHSLHAMAQARGIEFKLAAFFAGLEVSALAALHGVSQGKAADNGETWAAFVEASLGVPYRTAHRYRRHFESTAAAHMEIAKKLNQHWQAMTDKGAKALPENGGESLAGKLTPANLKTFCENADEWGLHELFEKATDEKDVTPEGGGGGKKSRAEIVKFYTQALKRVQSNEFTRLPVPQLQAFAEVMGAAVKKANALLAAKKK